MAARGYLGVGFAHLYSGQFDAGIKDLEHSIEVNPSYAQGHLYLAVTRTPDYPLAHRDLANALGRLERIDEAKVQIQRLLELSPDFSIAMIRDRHPFREEADLEHFIAGLREAGLPEK